MGNKQGNQTKGNSKSANKEDKKREQEEKKLLGKEEKAKKKQEAQATKKSTKKPKKKLSLRSRGQTSGSEFEELDTENVSGHFDGADSESGLFQSAENISTVSPYLDSCTRSERDQNFGIWGSSSSEVRHPQVLSSRDFRDGFSLEACIPPEIARPITYTTTDTSISSGCGATPPSDVVNPSSMTNSGSIKSKKSNNSSTKSRHHTPTFSLRHHHHNQHHQRHRNDDELSVSTSSSQKSSHGDPSGGYSTPLLNTPVFERADRSMSHRSTYDVNSPDKDIVDVVPALPYSSFDSEVKLFTTYNPTIISKNSSHQQQQQKHPQPDNHSYFIQHHIDYRNLPKPTSPHPQRRAFSPKMTSSPFKMISSDDSSSTPSTPIPQRKGVGILSDLFNRSNSMKRKIKNDNKKDTMFSKDKKNDASKLFLEDKSPKQKRKPIWKTWERSSSRKSNSSENNRNSIFGTIRKSEKTKDSTKNNDKELAFEESRNQQKPDRLSDITLKGIETMEQFDNERGENCVYARDEKPRKDNFEKIDGEENLQKGYSNSNPIKTLRNENDMETFIQFENMDTNKRDSSIANRNSSPPVAKSAAFCIMRLEELERNIEKTIREKFPDAEQFLLHTTIPPDEASVSRGSKSLPTTPYLKKKTFVTRDLNASQEDLLSSSLQKLSVKLEKIVGTTRVCEESFEDSSYRAKSPVIVRRFGVRTRHASISPKVQRAKMAAIYKSPSEMERMASCDEERSNLFQGNNDLKNDSPDLERVLIKVSQPFDFKVTAFAQNRSDQNESLKQDTEDKDKYLTRKCSSLNSTSLSMNDAQLKTVSNFRRSPETTSSFGSPRFLVRQKRIDDCESQENSGNNKTNELKSTEIKDHDTAETEAAVFGSVSPKLKRNKQILSPASHENNDCFTKQSSKFENEYNKPVERNYYNISQNVISSSNENNHLIHDSQIETSDYDNFKTRNSPQAACNLRVMAHSKHNKNIKPTSESVDSLQDKLTTDRLKEGMESKVNKTDDFSKNEKSADLSVISTSTDKSSDASQIIMPKYSVRSIVKSINKSLSEDVERTEYYRQRGRGRTRSERGRGRGSGSGGSAGEDSGFTSLPTSPLQQRFKSESKSNEGNDTQSTWHIKKVEILSSDGLSFDEGNEYTSSGSKNNGIRKEGMKIEIDSGNINNYSWRNASSANYGGSNLGGFNYGFISPTSPRRRDSSADQRVVFGAAVALPCRVYASPVSPNRTSVSSNSNNDENIPYCRKDPTERQPPSPLSQNSQRRPIIKPREISAVINETFEHSGKKMLRCDKWNIEYDGSDDKRKENKQITKDINKCGSDSGRMDDEKHVSDSKVNKDNESVCIPGEQCYNSRGESSKDARLKLRNVGKFSYENAQVYTKRGKLDDTNDCYRCDKDDNDSKKRSRDNENRQKSQLVGKEKLREENYLKGVSSVICENDNQFCANNKSAENYNNTQRKMEFSGASQVDGILERSQLIAKGARKEEENRSKRSDKSIIWDRVSGRVGEYYHGGITSTRDGDVDDRCVEYYGVKDRVQMSDNVLMAKDYSSPECNQNTHDSTLSATRDDQESFFNEDLDKDKAVHCAKYGLLSRDIRCDGNINIDDNENNNEFSCETFAGSTFYENSEKLIHENIQVDHSQIKTKSNDVIKNTDFDNESECSKNICRRNSSEYWSRYRFDSQSSGLDDILSYCKREINISDSNGNGEDVDYKKETSNKIEEKSQIQSSVLKLPISKVIFDMINTSKSQSLDIDDEQQHERLHQHQEYQQKHKQKQQNHQQQFKKSHSLPLSIENSQQTNSEDSSRNKDSLFIEPAIAMVTSPSYEQRNTFLEEGSILNSPREVQSSQSHTVKSPFTSQPSPQLQAAQNVIESQSLLQTNHTRVHDETETQNAQNEDMEFTTTSTPTKKCSNRNSLLTQNTDLRGSMILSSTETGESGDDAEMAQFVQSLQNSTSKFGTSSCRRKDGKQNETKSNIQQVEGLFITEDFVSLSPPPPPSPINALDKLIDQFREEDEDLDDEFDDSFDDFHPLQFDTAISKSWADKLKCVPVSDTDKSNVKTNKIGEEGLGLSVIMRDQEMRDFADKVMNRLSDLLVNVPGDDFLSFSDDNGDDGDNKRIIDPTSTTDEIYTGIENRWTQSDKDIGTDLREKLNEISESEQAYSETERIELRLEDHFISEDNRSVRGEDIDYNDDEDDDVHDYDDDTFLDLNDDSNFINDDKQTLFSCIDVEKGNKKPPIPKERILYSRFSTSSSLSTSTSSTSSSPGLFTQPPQPLDSPSIPKPPAHMSGLEGIEGAPRLKQEPIFFVFPDRIVTSQNTSRSDASRSSKGSSQSRNKEKPRRRKEHPNSYQPLQSSHHGDDKHDKVNELGDDDDDDDDKEYNLYNTQLTTRRSAQTRSYHSDDDVARGGGIPEYYDDRPLWQRRQKPPGQMSAKVVSQRRRERRERWLRKRQRNKTDLWSNASSEQSPKEDKGSRLSLNNFDDEDEEFVLSKTNLVSRTTEMGALGSGILSSPKYSKPIMPFLGSKENVSPHEDFDIEETFQKGNASPLQCSSVLFQDVNKHYDDVCDHVNSDEMEEGEVVSGLERIEEDNRNSRELLNVCDNHDDPKRLQGETVSIPGLEETFEELKSVQCLLEGLQGKPPQSKSKRDGDRKGRERNKTTQHSNTSEAQRDSKSTKLMPLTVENIRSIKEHYRDKDNNGRLSRLSNTNRTESDLDIYSEHRDDVSTDSNLYADDEGDDDDDDDIVNDPYTTAEDDLDTSLGDADLDNFVVGCTFYNSKTYDQQSVMSSQTENQGENFECVYTSCKNINLDIPKSNDRNVTLNRGGSEQTFSSISYSMPEDSQSKHLEFYNNHGNGNNNNASIFITNGGGNRPESTDSVLFSSDNGLNRTITITNTQQRHDSTDLLSSERPLSLNTPIRQQQQQNNNTHIQTQNLPRYSGYVRSNSDPGAFSGHQLSLQTSNVSDAIHSQQTSNIDNNDEFCSGRGVAYNLSRSYHTHPQDQSHQHHQQQQHSPLHHQRLRHFHSAPASTDVGAASGEVSTTFQNAREQMMDIQQHLQALRRQMEGLEEELSSTTSTSYTLTPDFSAYDSK